MIPHVTRWIVSFPFDRASCRNINIMLRSGTTPRVGILLSIDVGKSRSNIPPAKVKSHLRRLSILNTDGWKSQCNLPLSGGKLHLWRVSVIGHRRMEKSVHFAALWRQVATPACTDYWASMNEGVGASWRPPAARCTSSIYRSWYTPKWY